MSFLLEQLGALALEQNRWTWQTPTSKWPRVLSVRGNWSQFEEEKPIIYLPNDDYLYGYLGDEAPEEPIRNFGKYGPVPFTSPVPNHFKAVAEPENTEFPKIPLTVRFVGDALFPSDLYYVIGFEVAMERTSFGNYEGIGAFTVNYNRNILTTAEFLPWQILEGPQKSEDRGNLYLKANLRETSPEGIDTSTFVFTLALSEVIRGTVTSPPLQNILYQSTLTSIDSATDFLEKINEGFLEGDYPEFDTYVDKIELGSGVFERDPDIEDYM